MTCGRRFSFAKRAFPTEAEEAVEHFGQESAFPAPVARGTNGRILVLVRGDERVDQASVDLVYNQPHNHDLVERIETRHGLRQLSYMRELGMGSENYELVDIG